MLRHFSVLTGALLRRSSLEPDRRCFSLGTTTTHHRASDVSLDPHHAAILFRDSRGVSTMLCLVKVFMFRDQTGNQEKSGLSDFWTQRSQNVSYALAHSLNYVYRIIYVVPYLVELAHGVRKHACLSLSSKHFYEVCMAWRRLYSLVKFTEVSWVLAASEGLHFRNVGEPSSYSLSWEPEVSFWRVHFLNVCLRIRRRRTLLSPLETSQNIVRIEYHCQ